MLRSLLGHDVVLLPVVHGQKRPMISGWQHKTSEDMQDADYLATLSNGNIGVLLGAPSGNLCAIDIDDDAAVEPFLELNPNLRNTLRSRGSRGQQMWLRITGEYPALSPLTTSDGEPWGEWRASGAQSVIYGVHPTGTNYQFIHEVPPIEVRFEDIVWPDNLELPWSHDESDALIQEFGPPWIISKGDSIQLNHTYWVQHYLTEHYIVYDSTLQDFFEYDAETGLWKRKLEEHIQRKFNANLTQAANDNDLPRLHCLNTAGNAGALLNGLRIEVAQEDVFVERRTEAIHVPNGMLCREGNEFVLKTHSPEFYSRNMCAYAYDESAQCPKFLNDLLGTALMPEDIALLQKWAGACLMGKNRAQRIMLLTGTAGGGKSTIMTILEKVIGTHNVATLRTDQLGGRFEYSTFVGKTLLVGKDVRETFLMQQDTGNLKELTGGDLLSAEKKGQNGRVQFRGHFNVCVTSNTKLNVRLEGDVDAWRRRLLIIPFDKPSTTRPIADFAEQILKDEGTGVLRWMVQGAFQLMEDLDKTGNYQLSPRQLDNIDRLLSEGNSVDSFVRERVVAQQGAEVYSTTLLQAYDKYCKDKDLNSLPESKVPQLMRGALARQFNVVLRHDIKGNGGKERRGYRGVAIREEGDDAPAN